MASSAAETLIGAAVLAAAAGFIAYAAQTTELSAGGGSRYEITAGFRKAVGVSVGTDVRIAGVKVGAVSAMSLDPQTYRAQVTLSIDDAIKLPDDSDAAISAEGLLGGNYISVTPGGSDIMLAPGEEIMFTQGSVDFMDLVGRAISSSGSTSQ